MAVETVLLPLSTDDYEDNDVVHNDENVVDDDDYNMDDDNIVDDDDDVCLQYGAPAVGGRRVSARRDAATAAARPLPASARPFTVSR